MDGETFFISQLVVTMVSMDTERQEYGSMIGDQDYLSAQPLVTAIIAAGKQTSSYISMCSLGSLSLKKSVDKKIFFTIEVVGKEVFRVHNNAPQFFNNVQVYSADKWYQPAQVVVGSYSFKNLEKRKFFIYGINM